MEVRDLLNFTNMTVTMDPLYLVLYCALNGEQWVDSVMELMEAGLNYPKEMWMFLYGHFQLQVVVL